MAKTIMKATGVDGVVELMTDRVVIHRPGIFNLFKYGPNAKREIPLGAISEVGFKAPSMLVFGEIDFVRSGRSMEEKTKRASSAVKFGKKSQQEFETIKEKVFQMMEHHAKQRQ
jgi:hypothetical protein